MSVKKKVTDQYREHLTKVGKSPHTVRAYVRDLAAFARWFEGTTGEDFAPQAVDPRDIQDYKGCLIQKGLKPATINRRLIALGRFFRWAKQEGLIGDNPFEVLEQVLLKEQKDTAPRWLDRKEQLALLRGVRKRESKRDLAIIQTLLGTGLRISELAALKVSDLEISERKGWLYVRKGKGSKARDIPLDNKTRQVLSSCLENDRRMEPNGSFQASVGPSLSQGSTTW
jgi:site-specific recombinase XerD